MTTEHIASERGQTTLLFEVFLLEMKMSKAFFRNFIKILLQNAYQKADFY